MAKPSKRVLVVVAALLLAVISFVIVTRTRGSGQTTVVTRPSETTGSNGAVPGGSRMSAASTGARPNVGQGAEHRASMLSAIERARTARGQRTAAPATPGAPTTARTSSTATTLDLVDKTGDTSDWQKRAHGTLNSLLGQCYDLARAEDAGLEGTLTVRFTLVGEPGVGGLLEKVEIVDGDTTITQPTLRECVTQQLYALELDPPPDGVSVERQISLKFP